MSLHNEAQIIINGSTLSVAESMTIRAALESFSFDLHAYGLGEDETGKAICDGYLAAISRIRDHLYKQQELAEDE